MFDNHFKNSHIKKATTWQYKESQSPFYATRNLFIEYLNYDAPLTFEEWLSVEDDRKAAVLYVQFFEQITLAWYKVRSFYTDEEDGVETVLQYLIKNVSILVSDSKRFTRAYIYRVAYNCLYCICHDLKRPRERFERECSNIQESQGEEFDLFDTIIDADIIACTCDSESFWAAIHQLRLPEDLLEFVYSLADAKSKPQDLDDRKRAVVAKLREVLASYKDVYYN